MPRRHGSLESYKYGFQGQEKDDEIKGEGNSLNYTFRMHDPRVGRFFAVDPLTKSYPYYSPYQFAGNTPIAAIDLEGAEPFYTASRDFSIEWYNKNIVQTTPTPNLATTKFELVNAERLKQFAQDNIAQHDLGDSPVYYNSKKLGHYDCVTAVEASMQILKNDYTIKLPKGGNAEVMGKVWEKSGLVGKSNVYNSFNNAKMKKGDAVTKADFSVGNVGQDLIKQSGVGDGTTFFTLAFGKDFHGGMVSVTTSTDPTTGDVTNKFNIYHQLSERFDLSETEFNEYLDTFLYLNSTTDDGTGTGNRNYTPGNSGHISDGNQKVELRKVNQ